MNKLRDHTYIAVFLLLILAVWMGFSVIPRANIETPAPTNGTRDLSAFDFADTLCRVADLWEAYPEKLYTPEDFSSGAVSGAPQYLTDDELLPVQYATHRLTLKLPPNAVYAMSLRSSDFAMRIYIDGREFDSVGVPGSSRETTVPRVSERVYTFYTESGAVELIAQTANFVHKDSGSPPVFTIGLPQNVSEMKQHNDFMSALIVGALLLACLYHLALFLLNRSRVVILLYAFCCLLSIFVTNRIIPMVWPDYNWFIALRFEYIVHFLTFGALTLFLSMLYPGLLHKTLMRCYWGLTGLYIIATLLLDSTIYTRLLIVFDIVSAAVGLYVLIRLAMQTRGGRLRHFLSFAGILVLALFGINDILSHNGIVFIGPIAGQVFTAPVGMLFFVVCYALTLSDELRESEAAVGRAKLEIAEAKARYTALLEQVESGSSEQEKPRANLSDFNLSERETNVALLLIDGKQRKEIAALLGLSIGTVNTYCSRVYTKTGSGSVAELCKRLGVLQSE